MQVSLESLFMRYRTTGQPEALGELFDRASPQLLALALHLCGHPADAEDALQATFVAAIDRAASWSAQRPLLPWLCGILDKQCRRIGQRRARRRERELPAEPVVLDDGSPLAATERRELVAQLREHIDRLPVEQRQVLLLQLEHGLAPAEVADVLGVPPGTVRMRLHRGVQALRGVLPASLVLAVLAALPSRGVAAVRAAVVGHAAAALAAGGGAMVAKPFAVAAAIALLCWGGMAWAPWTTAEAPGPTSAAAPVRLARLPASDADVAGARAAGDRDLARVAAPELVASEATAATPTGSLRIVVVSERDHAPVPHLPLRVCRLGVDADTRSFVSAATGDDGSAVLADQPPGRVRVVAAANGQAEGEVLAARETCVELAVAVAPQFVRGVVHHADGRVAPGATVVAGPPYEAYAEPVAVADAGGTFALTLPHGFLTIGARAAGCASSEMQFLPTTDAPIEIVLLGAEAVVAGEVVDGDGAPIAAAHVEIGTVRLRGAWTDERGHRFDRTPPQRLRTGADGRFAATALRVGEVGVEVCADGFAPFHRYVTLRAGTGNVVCCELQRGVVVHGRVVDQRGEPVAGASVCLGDIYGVRRTTDGDGRFRYRDGVVGVQQLRVEGEDLVSRFAERTAGTEDEWVVVVERAARYRLRFVDESSQPLAEWQVQLHSAFERTATTDGAGRVALCALGAGQFRMLLGAPDDLQASMVCPWPEALPGIETTVVVPAAMRPSAILRGRVLEPEGAPFANAWLSLVDRDGRFVRSRGAEAARFEMRDVPAGDLVLVVARQQDGCALLRVPIHALQRGEVRDLGDVRLPNEGSVRASVLDVRGGVAGRADVFLWNDAHEESRVPNDGAVHAMPAGRYRWQVMDDDSLWQRGTLEVRVGETTALDVVLQPGVRRYLRFPVPAPDWGAVTRVDFVVRAPDGSVYDSGDFDPREEMPYRYMPTLAVGSWRLELSLGDGRRFTGAFTVESLAPSRTPIDVAVAPSR